MTDAALKQQGLGRHTQALHEPPHTMVAGARCSWDDAPGGTYQRMALEVLPRVEGRGTIQGRSAMLPAIRRLSCAAKPSGGSVAGRDNFQSSRGLSERPDHLFVLRQGVRLVDPVPTCTPRHSPWVRHLASCELAVRSEEHIGEHPCSDQDGDQPLRRLAPWRRQWTWTRRPPPALLASSCHG